jgi:hypothetical protein
LSPTRMPSLTNCHLDLRRLDSPLPTTSRHFIVPAAPRQPHNRHFGSNFDSGRRTGMTAPTRRKRLGGRRICRRSSTSDELAAPSAGARRTTPGEIGGETAHRQSGTSTEPCRSSMRRRRIVAVRAGGETADAQSKVPTDEVVRRRSPSRSSGTRFVEEELLFRRS